MNNKKLTDKEIVKALEYCKDCSANLNVEIIDLITHQQSEIDRLNKEIQITKDAYTMLQTKTEIIKFEAIKEFAEKLKNICEEIMAQEWNEKTAPISWSYAYAGFIDDIDTLLKEMVGKEE